MKDQGKALQAIACLLFSTEGYAALAPGYLHRQAMCIAFQASLSCPIDLSGEPIIHHFFVLGVNHIWIVK